MIFVRLFLPRNFEAVLGIATVSGRKNLNLAIGPDTGISEAWAAGFLDPDFGTASQLRSAFSRTLGTGSRGKFGRSRLTGG